MLERFEREHVVEHIKREQSKVNWREKILVHFQEHLYIVQKGNQKIVKCDCGYEFGHYKTNWKDYALVYDRNPKEVYLGMTGHNPEWCAYREFYCPGCGVQLEVEAVPHGVPFLFSVELDLGDQ